MLYGLFATVDRSAVGRMRAPRCKNYRRRILASPTTTGEEQLRQDPQPNVVLFNHACRYELFDHNPISLVRQGSKRRTPPIVLTPVEVKELLDRLALREQTLVLLAASTGLRQSELFGLKWLDIDFELKTMSVTRSIVCGVVGPCKTESSQKPVPLDPHVADTLLKWKENCRYRKPGD